jgi:hypothetical protein
MNFHTYSWKFKIEKRFSYSIRDYYLKILYNFINAMFCTTYHIKGRGNNMDKCIKSLEKDFHIQTGIDHNLKDSIYYEKDNDSLYFCYKIDSRTIKKRINYSYTVFCCNSDCRMDFLYP